MMVWKMIFLFNWVIFRFQPLIFRGVGVPPIATLNMETTQRPHLQAAGLPEKVLKEIQDAKFSEPTPIQACPMMKLREVIL